MIYRHPDSSPDCRYVIREKEGIKYYVCVRLSSIELDPIQTYEDDTGHSLEDKSFELNRDIENLIPVLES